MKKKLLFFCILIYSVFVISGCHGTDGLAEFTIPENFDTQKSYEITFWAKNDTNKAQTNVYKKAISDFEALYPNIKVNMRLYTDYGRIYNDVITNISTGTTPNVCITYPDHIATYMTGINIVVPIDSIMNDSKYGLNGSEVKFEAPTVSEIVPEYLEECRFNENYYALPYMRSTEALYINEDYVRALGYEIPDVVTWDFVFEVSEKALEMDSDGNYLINNQKVMIPFIYKSTDNMMISYLKQMNAGYSTSDGQIELFNDTTGAFLEEIGIHAASGAFSTFKISSYPANFLNAGQCIFAVDSTAGSTWMGSEAPNLDISEEDVIDFNIVVRPIPQADETNIKMISQGPSVCIFNKEDPQEVLASWLFTQFLLTNDVQIGYSKTEGYTPVTTKARESSEYQEYLSLAGTDTKTHYQVKLDATNLLLNNTDHTFVTPVFNGSTSLRDAAGTLIEYTTKSARRGTLIDNAFLTKTYEDIASLHKLDQISTTSQARQTLGELPTTSIILIGSLITVWIGIMAIFIISRRKGKK